MAASSSKGEHLEVDGEQVPITHPDKVVFPDLGVTKLDLMRYYLAVAPGALRGVAERPMILKRFVKGITEEAVFQKRAPEKNRPDYVDVAELRYASGTSAKEAVLHDAAGLVWAVNLGCVDLNPHPVRADDLAHPDELRVDLDPMPGVDWRQIIHVALVAREVLEDHGLTAWPKTSGSRGFHIYARIERRWPFKFVRLAAQAVAREVERRAPDLATARWWKEERGGRFRRLQPERVRPHGGFGVLGAGHPRRQGVDAAAVGRGRRLPPGELHHRDGAQAIRRTRRSVGGHGRRDGPPRPVARPRRPARPGREGAQGREEGNRPRGRPSSSMPLIEIARTKTKDEAMAALDTWRDKYEEVAKKLKPVDVLLDGMRGPSSIWYRIRINLQHVPEDLRPPQEDAARGLQPVGELLRRTVPPPAEPERSRKPVLSKVLAAAPQCLRSAA